MFRIRIWLFAILALGPLSPLLRALDLIPVQTDWRYLKGDRRGLVPGRDDVAADRFR